MAFAPVYAGVGDNKLDVYGATPAALWTIAFGAGDTYVAGGLPLVAATFGLSRPIAGVLLVGVNTAAFVNGWVWNSQTQKFMGLTVGVSPAAYVDLVAATALVGVVLTVLVLATR